MVKYQPRRAGSIEQIGAGRAAVSTAPATPAEVAAAFPGAPVPLVARHLETLATVGEVRLLPTAATRQSPSRCNR